jgi:hypothetical protein
MAAAGGPDSYGSAGPTELSHRSVRRNATGRVSSPGRSGSSPVIRAVQATAALASAIACGVTVDSRLDQVRHGRGERGGERANAGAPCTAERLLRLGAVEQGGELSVAELLAAPLPRLPTLITKLTERRGEVGELIAGLPGRRIVPFMGGQRVLPSHPRGSRLCAPLHAFSRVARRLPPSSLAHAGSAGARESANPHGYAESRALPRYRTSVRCRASHAWRNHAV